MKCSFLCHGLWFGAVLTAYWIGHTRSTNRSTESAPEISSSVFENGGSNRADAEPARRRDLSAQSNPFTFKRELSETHIEELGRQFKDELNPTEGRLASARLLEGLTVDNAMLIRAQFAHLDEKSVEFREFHYAWGEIAGQDAVTHCVDTPKRDLAVTMAGWARANPASALDWFANLGQGDPYDKTQLKYGIAHGLALTDPEAAGKYVIEAAEAGDENAGKMLGLVTGKLLQAHGPVETAAWATGLPASPLRDSALVQVAHDYVSRDPEAAAEWAQQFVNEEPGARVAEVIGDRWAKRDPASAVAWVESLETGGEKSAAFQSAFGQWALNDPQSASAYLVDMQDSKDRNAAIGGFVSRLAWEDPASAITWAGEITDPGAQQRALVQAGRAYHRREPLAALEWLESSGLSEAAQQEVLRPPQGR